MMLVYLIKLQKVPASCVQFGWYCYNTK